MAQLSYEPAFDPFHAAFRVMRLRASVLKLKPLHKDHIRILDYYLLFPFRMVDLRLRRQDLKLRGVAKKRLGARPYGELPQDRILLGRMAPIQVVALDSMIAKGVLKLVHDGSELIEAGSTELPLKLQAAMDERNAEDADLIEGLAILAAYPLLGVGGLKDRSSLLDFRYDAV